MIINLPTKRILAMSHSNNNLSVLPTRWRRKPGGIDMERNYVDVTVCISCRSAKSPLNSRRETTNLWP